MQRIILKRLITLENKYVIAGMAAFLVSSCYGLTNALSFQVGPTLEIPEFEAQIPFLPWTVWIYGLLYPLYLLWALIHFRDEDRLNKTLYVTGLMTLVSNLWFMLFPVVYPRHLFPIPETGGLTPLALEFIRFLDKPSNCIPSLHVGYCYVFAFHFFGYDKKRFSASILASTLVAISTLTLKQHYIIDIAAGFLIALFLHLGISFGTKIAKT